LAFVVWRAGRDVSAIISEIVDQTLGRSADSVNRTERLRCQQDVFADEFCWKVGPGKARWRMRLLSGCHIGSRLSRQLKVVLRKLCQDLSLDGVASVGVSDFHQHQQCNILPSRWWWWWWYVMTESWDGQYQSVVNEGALPATIRDVSWRWVRLMRGRLKAETDCRRRRMR